MINLNKLCRGCFEPNQDVLCLNCGLTSENAQTAPYLPLGTVLGERYIIGKAMNKAGEGVTYYGWDKIEDAKVFIREFLPLSVSVRGEDGQLVLPVEPYEHIFAELKTEFLKLCRSLARMRGLTSMLEIYDILEENGTAYHVSEYIENKTFREYLLDKGGSLSWDKARQLLMPVLSTLNALHKAGLVHMGLSPETLLMCDDGKVRLCGFSIAAARNQNSDIIPQLFAGYSALEQYGFEGDYGPWTDIYAFAACIYRTLVGNTPPEAASRVTNDRLIIPARVAENLPAYVMVALANALQILPDDRTHSVDQFRDELSAAPSVTNRLHDTREMAQVSAPAAPPEPREEQESGGYKRYGLIAAIVSLVVLGGLIWLISAFVFPSSDPGANPTGPTTTTDPFASDMSSTSTAAVDQVRVPGMVGLRYEDVAAPNGPYAKNFVIEVVEEVFSEDKPEGIVLSQDVEAGTYLAKGETIKVTVSKGSSPKDLPNVIGREFSVAVDILNAAGYTNITRIDSYDAAAAAGTVTGMDPAPGSSAEVGRQIRLFVKVADAP